MGNKAISVFNSVEVEVEAELGNENIQYCFMNLSIEPKPSSIPPVPIFSQSCNVDRNIS